MNGEKKFFILKISALVVVILLGLSLIYYTAFKKKRVVSPAPPVKPVEEFSKRVLTSQEREEMKKILDELSKERKPLTEKEREEMKEILEGMGQQK